MGKLEQIEALDNGKGIQYLLDSAHKIFNNPIAMFDTNYDLKLYANVTSDDPLWNELVSTGTFCMETQEFFAKECFTEAVANANKLVILKSNKLKYDRILGHIFNREQIRVTMIVMVAVNGPLKEDELLAFERLVDKATVEIRDDEYYTAYGRAYHEGIIIKLLNGIINDPLLYTPHVQILYEGFDDYLYVAVVDMKQNKTHKNDLDFFNTLFEGNFQLFKYAFYSGYIVMIMSSKQQKLYEKQFFSIFDDLFKRNNLYAGVSSSFENLYDLRYYYDKAVTALKNGIESKSDQRIFLAET